MQRTLKELGLEVSRSPFWGASRSTESPSLCCEVPGHPVIHLWLSTDAVDLDAFVYLEEV